MTKISILEKVKGARFLLRPRGAGLCPLVRDELLIAEDFGDGDRAT